MAIIKRAVAPAAVKEEVISDEEKINPPVSATVSGLASSVKKDAARKEAVAKKAAAAKKTVEKKAEPAPKPV